MQIMKKDLQEINLRLREKISDNMKVIGFISPKGDFERQTVLANLAVMYSNSKQKTLIVNTDSSKSVYQSIFNLKKSEGLIDYLLDDNLLLADFIQQTDNEFLAVMESGEPENKGLDYLSNSFKFKKMIENLKANFANILVDIKFSSNDLEGISVLNSCDAVIIVENSKITNKRAMNKMLRSLLKNNIKVVGYIDVKK